MRIVAPVRGSNNFMFWGGWTTIITICLFYTINIPLRLLMRSSRGALCSVTQSEGCMNYVGLIMSSAAFNVLADVVIILLPLRAIWKLHLDIKKKIGVYMHFTTGIL